MGVHMSSRIKIIDNLSNSTLYEFSMEDADRAYQKSEELEEMGLDIKLVIPSVSQTLIESLGASSETIEKLKEMMDEEIASHINEEDGGCSICLPDGKIHQ